MLPSPYQGDALPVSYSGMSVWWVLAGSNRRAPGFNRKLYRLS